MKYSKFMFAASLVLTSCGAAVGAQVPAWKANSQVDVPTVKVGRNWRATLNVLPTDEQNKKLYDSWQQGISRCMDANGFKYEPGIYYSDNWMDNWNPLDEAWGNQFGYHNPKSDFPQPEQSDDVAFQQMLENTCAPQASAATFDDADVKAFTTEVDHVINDAMRVIAEPGNAAEEAAMPKWSACMSNHGLKFSNRHEISQKFEGQSRISNEELTTKGADIACDRQVGMTQSRSVAEEKALNVWKSEQQNELQNLQQLRVAFDKAVANL